MDVFKLISWPSNPDALLHVFLFFEKISVGLLLSLMNLIFNKSFYTIIVCGPDSILDKLSKNEMKIFI